jgi:DnaJ-class molecular chaperone
MAKRDYYDVLGVGRSASADEIRKAYRTLARQLHPDVNKAADASKKFTEVQEAYDVLSDEQKKKLYDQFGHAGVSPGAGGPAPAGGGRPHYSWSNVGGPGGVSGAEFDAEDLGSMFEAFFGERGGHGAGFGGGMGGMGGATRGRPGAGKARRAGRTPEAEPAAIEHELDITFMTAARGGTEPLRLNTDGKSRTIEVKIPKGTADGARLRVRGGADGQDIILRIKVGPHPVFRRTEHGVGPQGLDLYLDLPLSIAEAALGATVTAPTLDGSVELRIPPGTASGRKLRVRGQGLEDAKGARGDLYAVVKIVPPESGQLSAADAAALRRISESGPSPRADWPV